MLVKSNSDEQIALERAEKLLKALNKRSAGVELCERYYNGNHNLRFATRKYRESFGALFKEFQDNWTAIVVDACVERMRIEGFRFPLQEDGQEAEGSDNSTSDPVAWDLWQRNNLDRDSDIAHEQAFITGNSYIIVGPQEDGTVEYPLITVEHPLEVITEHAAGNRRVVSAAIKRWYDEETELVYLTLYLPKLIWRFQSTSKFKSNKAPRQIKWELKDDDYVMDNPFGDRVPVIQLSNRTDLLGNGRSEIKEIIPIQNAVNKTMNDAMLASEFGSYRQRVILGMETPKDDKGNVIPNFDLVQAQNRWMFVPEGEEGTQAKIQELEVSDLSQYVSFVELCVNHIAARTRTPPQYLVGKVVNVSGDALKAAESGLVSKVKRRSRFFGEGWEEAMRLAFLLKGDTKRAESYRAETIWGNPEIQSASALSDSLAKLAAIGVPPQALWEKSGASQTEIARWEGMAQKNKEIGLVIEAPAIAAEISAAGKEGE